MASQRILIFAIVGPFAEELWHSLSRGAMADRRLVILVRQVLGGLWSDSEVEKALKSVPQWWNDEHRPG